MELRRTDRRHTGEHQGGVERSGETAQWAQYSERVAALSPAEWERVAAETTTFEVELSEAKRTGVDPATAVRD